MGIIKTGNDSTAAKVDDLGLRPALELGGIIDAGKFVADDHDLVDLGMPGIECRDSSVFEDKICDWFHESFRSALMQLLRHDLRFNRGLWCVVNHGVGVFHTYAVGTGLLFQ